MMAAEANQSKSVVEAAGTSSTEPTITITTDSQNVDSKLALVNGTTVASASPDEIEHKQLADIVDDLVNSADVSISGGSDTEASKADGASSKYGDKGHGRTSSAVKKLAFKSVSVNKTFLGNKGSVTNAPLKTGEKASATSTLASGQSTSSSSVARPRLVAKFGSARDGTKGSAGSNGKPANVPDPSAVWNKNRPPPAPEPKRFTDEELKKYGIHMANRLAPDDARGQSNWADIDDDDEDWVPGEIQWNDGTKVTIPEPSASPVPEPVAPAAPSQPAAPPAPLPKENKVIEKPRSPAPTASPSIKPGVLASGKGLVLKGAPEKPTLVARPPAPPAPIKSPWATLPPVEKAPPIVVDYPTPQNAGRPGPREGPPGKSMTPPPAKEIAADDFSRSGGPPNPNRELFNSQSGRYEPVMDRRGSARSEAYSRHPAAVLQRPVQSEGPAEPSPAFQTSRTSGQEPPYGRRRGSSNVSGGSGSFFQRLPKPHDQVLPPPEVLNARRGSLTAGSEHSPVSPRNFSPSGPRHHGPAWHPRTSPRGHYAVPHHAQQGVPYQDPNTGAANHGQPPVRVPDVDEYENQKRVMAEKRELARQRKLEEEAKAEAEKQKRIAAKLASLGPAPESRSAKQAAAKEESSTSAPAQAQKPGPSHDEQNSQQQTLAEDAKPTDIKVQNSDGDLNGGKTLAPQSKTQSSSGASSGIGGTAAPPDGRHSSNQDGKSSQPWQSATVAAQSERFSWGSGSQQTSRNVWGAPSNTNRSLGNGTFNSDLGRVPDSYPPRLQMAAKSGSAPGPIGPPSGTKNYAPAHPNPIGPPKNSAATSEDGGSRLSAGTADDAKSRWAGVAMATDERATAEAREHAAEQKHAGPTEDSNLTYHDTWKPVNLGSDGRRVETKDRVHAVHSSSWKHDQASPAAPGAPAAAPAVGTTTTSGTPQGRPSRFFPSRDVRTEEGPAAQNDNLSRSHPPSPPPPDMDGHPAFDGDIMRPHVALPPSRPYPVVRLPPSVSPKVSTSTPAPVTAPSSGASQSPSFKWASHTPYADTTHAPASQARSGQTSNWQEKFNHLFHDSKPLPHHHSRGATETGLHQAQAAVPLPTFMITPSTNDRSPTSKGMAEECFEEQEMGSLPPVRIPTTVTEAAWHPAAPPAKSFPKRFQVSPTTVDGIDEPQPTRLHVLVPGMSAPKFITLPMSGRSWSNSRRSNRGRNAGPRHTAGPHRGGEGPGGRAGGAGSRSRDPSVSYSHDNNGPSGSGSGSGSNAPSSGRGRGGGYRRSADWSRRASTPVQT